MEHFGPDLWWILFEHLFFWRFYDSVVRIRFSNASRKRFARFDEIYERLIFVKKEKDEEFLEECQPTEEKNKFERPKTSTGGTAALMDLRAKLKEELEKAKKGS